MTALMSSEMIGRLDRIGGTPMRRVEIECNGRITTVHLKLESANPGGSIKDRTALGLIFDAIRRGYLTEGKTVIESTSGNLGVAAALICEELGYPFIAVIDPKTTAENIAKIRAYGATVVCVEEPDETGGYLLSRLRYIERRLRLEPGLVWLNQYGSAANVDAHYVSTAPELWMQMGGHVDAIFIAVSTGGTLAGVSRYLRRLSPAMNIIAVDAVGSIALSGQPGARYLTGIGASRRSSFLERTDYTHVVHVTDAEAFGTCLAVRARTGLALGGSSGAVLYAAAEWLKHEQVDRAVCLCPDGGENYRETIFNPEWLAGHVPAASSVALALGGRIGAIGHDKPNVPLNILSLHARKKGESK
jgi:2,3-diaminopropionate biosynthesis protein SbnA